MIYDCFPFFNEVELLEIRLNILDEVVDKFVIAEANQTHLGKPKEFIFEKNKNKFEKFLDKIIYIKVENFPKIDPTHNATDGNNWILENFQRDQLMLGLSQCSDDDIIMISDLDEIPNPKIIKKYKKKGSGIWKLNQKMMYYFLNNLCITNPNWQHGTRIGTFRDLKDPKQNLEPKPHFRFSKKGLPTYFRNCLGKRIKNAGWHFSYLGGVEAIIKKRNAIAEQHLNNTQNMNPEEIEKNIKSGNDILGREEFKYRPVFIGYNFPKYIRNNKEKYKHLIVHHSTIDYIIVIINYLATRLKKKISKHR